LVYVSITGLELKSVRHAPVFWWHAIRSIGQAPAAGDPIRAEERLIKGVHRILREWAISISLEPSAYGTHSMRRTKVVRIYKKTGNLRAVQLLPGHTKMAGLFDIRALIWTMLTGFRLPKSGGFIAQRADPWTPGPAATMAFGD
jgi:hypothetical protein